MMSDLNHSVTQIFSTQTWDEHFAEAIQHRAIENLEAGQILHLPKLAFKLAPDEIKFLSADYADPHAKNISYHPDYHRLCGVQHLNDDEHSKLKAMLDRFSCAAQKLVCQLFPSYASHLMIARTSFRPVQISGRKTSYRKDDKRLHVDAFPSAPNQGKRILRVFCNINPNGDDRVWRVGEPFEKVAQQFLSHLTPPFPGTARALRLLKITKSYRTLYDHYMLKLHDAMKADDHYQIHAEQIEMRFPPGSSWIVQTDHVSHAAMQGQHVLEQTFYLPVTAMRNEQHAPLRVLERMLAKRLV